MTQNKKWFIGIGAGLAILFTCCFGLVIGSALTRRNQAQPEIRAESAQDTVEGVVEAVNEATPVPSPTAVPVYTPDHQPERQPDNTNLLALRTYAEAIDPLLEDGLAAAERDGQIVQQAEGNPEALCDGPATAHPTLLSDQALMARLLADLKEVSAPPETADLIHKPLTDSLTLWGEALDKINRSCQTTRQSERDLLRLGAVLQLGGSMINFHVAADNFWRLMVVYGLEAIAGPQP